MGTEPGEKKKTSKFEILFHERKLRQTQENRRQRYRTSEDDPNLPNHWKT